MDERRSWSWFGRRLSMLIEIDGCLLPTPAL
jgi:hypothetical protein